MQETQLDSLHEAIHHSLRAGDFDAVERLGGELGRAIACAAARAASSERVAFLQRSLSRLQEHLGLACVLRAHLASQLKTNTAVCLYHSETDSQHCWGFDA